MNRKMILYTLAQLVTLEGFLLLLPAVTALIYAEYSCAVSFFSVSAGALLFGMLVLIFLKTPDKTIYAREGFITVALAWVIISAIGALPFVLCGDIPSYTDAFFETVSGITTTGASILRDVETLNHGSLFWRSFTHWIGGMGVIVLMMAIMPSGGSGGRSMHIMRAEIPGPKVDKIVPKVRGTAKLLYVIYITLTLVEVLFLMLGGMSFFESLMHSFGTAGTGGFGVRGDSIGSYSPYIKWVITIFMLIFGVNFNLYYLILTKKFSQAYKSEELRNYLVIVVVSVVLIAANTYGLYNNIGETLTESAFQVSSIITTTGYSTVDFDQWPEFSKAVLLTLMFVGGCAGSTAGGLKVSRIIILLKSVKSEFTKLLHPRSVVTVKFEGKPLEDSVKRGVMTYFAFYSFILAGFFLIISLEPFSLETNLSAVIACFNNVGPGFANVGPMSSYADYSSFAKVMLSMAMLLGRLEIYPIMLTLAPSTWTGKNKIQLRNLFEKDSD